MDLKTSFAFYFVSLALYLIVLTAMALADKRVMGTQWLAWSVVIELVKVGLQGMADSVPRLFSIMVANELNMMAFFAMYMGLRWFVRREPLRNLALPAMLGIAMTEYCVMFVLHVPYAFHVMALTVVLLCGTSVRMLWRQREERFLVPARIMSALLSVHIGLVLYRMVLSAAAYRHGTILRRPPTDLRLDASMMFILMLANCLLILYVWFAAAEMYSAVEATAGIDALTGCVNRRALMKLAAHEVLRSERTGMPLTVVAMDLDHFKQVNDTYGHAGGDAVLCALATLIKSRLRPVDVMARTGGEEFLLILPDTDAIAGAKVVEGLRQAVQEMRAEHEECQIAITLSAGVTQILPRPDTWTAMVSRADQALYAAKAAGRNIITVDEVAAKLPRRAAGIREDESILEGRITGRAEGAALRLIRRRQG
ncbi:MAG: diguanylate cyclase [Acidobacteriaceae bacterium]|nr:diguanylate cyclase [Acidobacteriaceae bacterium]